MIGKNGNERAKYAYEKVKKVKMNQKEYRSLVRSFPMMVRNSGLARAVAFLLQKDAEGKKEGKEYNTLYRQIETWLTNTHLISDENLKDAIWNADPQTYRLLLHEVMELVFWLKSFAEGMFDDV